jgi:chemotaxis response regulator CheB
MKGKVFLVEWDESSAQARASALRREGFQVEFESANGGRAYRAIRTSVPDVVVIHLESKASHGREVGGALRELKATRGVPIVCIEEGIEAREVTRTKIPDALFTTEGELSVSLDHLARDMREAQRGPSSSKRKIARV